MAKKRKKKSQEPPFASCLLLCKDVMQSTAMETNTLVGVIDKLLVHRLPGLAGPFVAYLRLSNLRNGTSIQLRIEDESGSTVIETRPMIPDSSHPLDNHTLVLPVPAFPIKTEGRYRFLAMHDEVPFVQSPIFVKAMSPASEVEDHDVDESDQ